MAGKKKGNIVRYHRSLNINIGLVIFVFIFIYVVFNVYTFVTSKHVSYVEVDEGSLMVSTSYRGLALRDEHAVKAPATGRINYYQKENSKASTGSLVCSIDENGATSKKISETAGKTTELDEDTFNELIADIQEFGNRYRDDEYYESYTFRDDISAELYEALNLSAYSKLELAEDKGDEISGFHRIYAKKPGIVSYYEDGYEKISLDDLSEKLFDESDYEKTNLKLTDTANEGKMIYKLISSEDWKIVIPVDEEIVELLADTNVMQIRFKKDEATAWAYTKFIERDDMDYLVLSLNNSMIRYLSDRFLDIDLMLDNAKGLKISNSSIATKEFFSIPKKYFTRGGNSDSLGVIVVETDEEGVETDKFVAADIYGKNIGDDDESEYDDSEIMYYVSESELTRDTVIKSASDNNDRYTLERTVNMQGVYNVNKGYAVFRKIEILYKNEEYAIIAKGTKYGISMYDHIVLDASVVEEGEVI